MSRLISVPFDDALIDSTGGNPKVLTSGLSNSGQYPVIDQGQRFIAGYVDDKSLLFDRSNSPVIIFGDHTKLLKYVDFDFVLGADGVKVLTARSGFLTRFLFHYLSSISLPTDAGYSRHFKFLKRNLVPKPSLPEQQRIVDALDKAESICNRGQMAVELTDQFLNAVFLDFFGDPQSNPKGWPITPLSSICEVATGATPNRSRLEFYRGTIPWVKTGEVDQDRILSTEENISLEAIAETNCKVFPVETILIAMYGQGKTRGKCGVLGIPAATNQACAAVLPSTHIDSTYLLHLLRVSYDALRAMGRGGNQENLNLGMIKGLRIPLPAPEIQKKFCAIVLKVNMQKGRRKVFVSEAFNSFRALQQQAFN